MYEETLFVFNILVAQWDRMIGSEGDITTLEEFDIDYLFINYIVTQYFQLLYTLFLQSWSTLRGTQRSALPHSQIARKWIDDTH